MVLQIRRGEHVLVLLDAGAGEGHDKNRGAGQGVGFPQPAVRVDTQSPDGHRTAENDAGEVPHAGDTTDTIRRRRAGVWV